jgi:hypothetical protein
MSQPLVTAVAMLVLFALPIIFWITMSLHRDAIGE